MNERMKKKMCKIGIHEWWPLPYFTDEYVYLVHCARCGIKKLFTK